MAIKKVYLMGGLGNVFFQINFAFNLAKNNDLVINTFFLRRNFLTKFLNWSIHNTESDLFKINILNEFKVTHNFDFGVILICISRIFRCKILNYCFFGLQSPDINYSNINGYAGYFHFNNRINNNFINKLKFELDYLFSANIEKFNSYDLNLPVVHIRGGDYLKDSTKNINPNYYKIALLCINSYNLITNDVFFAKHILGDKFKYSKIINTNDSLLDFCFLYKSNYKILANSTFSWWSAEVSSQSDIIIQNDPFFETIIWEPFSNIHRKKIVVKA